MPAFCETVLFWLQYLSLPCFSGLVRLLDKIHTFFLYYIQCFLAWTPVNRYRYVVFVYQEPDLFVASSEPFAIPLYYATHQIVISGHYLVWSYPLSLFQGFYCFSSIYSSSLFSVSSLEDILAFFLFSLISCRSVFVPDGVPPLLNLLTSGHECPSLNLIFLLLITSIRFMHFNFFPRLHLC